MTSESLKKIIFMMFDEKLLDDVVRISEKYQYIENDQETEVAILTSKIYTTTERYQILEYIQELKKLSNTEIFPDIQSLIITLLINAYESNLVDYADLIRFYSEDEVNAVKFENKIIYNTPAYARITINGKDFDEQMDIINKCQTYLGDEVIFRNVINKVTKPSYKHNLRVRHALEIKDFDYGLDAVKDLIELFYIEKINEKITNKNFKELASDYVIILDFMSAFQIIGKKFTNTQEYFKVLKMFENTILEFSFVALMILEKPYEEVLKAITDTKKRLENDIGISPDETKKYLEPIMQRLRDANKVQLKV